MKIGQGKRQGDVLLVRIKKAKLEGFAEMPKDEHGRVVLAYGETSGHAHVFRAQGVCQLRREGTGERVVTLDFESELLHDQGGEVLSLTGEHGTMRFAAHDYRVIPQREWVGQGVQRAQDGSPGPRSSTS